MSKTYIKEVRNNSTATALLRNYETGQVLSLSPGRAATLTAMAVPWCGDGNGWSTRHILVTFGTKRFAVWQASHNLIDRVRLSANGLWSAPGAEIGGFAAVGPLETILGGADRTLVINDTTLWLLPQGLTNNMRRVSEEVRAAGWHMCYQNVGRPEIHSSPKTSAVAFSMAGVPSNLYLRGQPDARLAYRDSGTRYEFRIQSGVTMQLADGGGTRLVNGVVVMRNADGSFPTQLIERQALLTEAFSLNRTRRPEKIPLPEFDLMAASGGRVLAKQKGTDRFFFATVDELFLHKVGDAPEGPVPSTYFKLDPEYNKPGASRDDLMASLTGDFGSHPVAERFSMFRFAMEYGITEMMMARLDRGKWYLIDDRPPLDLRAVLPAMRDALSGFTSVMSTMMKVPQARIDEYIKTFIELPTLTLPQGMPGYNHVEYCSGPNAGRLDVFALLLNGTVVQKTFENGWKEWSSLGGQLDTEPAAVSWGHNRIDLFGRGKDGTVHYLRYDGQWRNWESLGGNPASAPTVCTWGPGRLDVFVRGKDDNALWHTWFDGQWRPWESLGGVLDSEPAAVSWGHNRIDVFARGKDGTLIHKWYDGQWRNWESLGGFLTSAPAVSSWGPGRLDVFVRGNENALWHKWFERTWSPWGSLGGTLYSRPAAACWAPNRIDIFTRGVDLTLQHKWFDGQWRNWESLGGNISTAPAASSWGPNRIAVSSIDMAHVLDIGVGHVHYHEQYDRTTGGELQPMLSHPPTTEFLADYPEAYRWINGPVQDGDGYIDGTCNFYVLARLRDGRHFLLYMDEQLFFTQRWRLVDPQDYDGLNLALVAGLHSDLKAVPRRYNWSPARYWCPFRAGYVGANSRLAVAAQVLLVNGGTKPEDPSTAELYSINFSWSTMDRTWRWRKFPAPACYFKAGTAQFEQMEEAACPPAPEPGCVYPETIRLREDMTIHVKGMRRMADGTVSKGRWFQRYLPATNKMPAVAAAGSRPEAYTHQWRFMTEEAWAAADRFSHLGVYGIVNSRMQCYVLQFSKPETRTILEQAGAGPWFEPNGKLWVEGYSFRWQTLQLHWPPVLPPPKGARRPPSLFNPAPMLRIVNRGGQWIAMHWDKRDDDLLPYGGPDAEVELQNGTSRVSVRVLDNRRFEEPPVVTSAGFWLEQTGTPGSPRAFLGFVTPKQQGGLANVWRVRLEAIVPGQFDATVSILNLTSDNFTISAEGFHQYSWQPTAEQSAQLTKYCSSEGAMRYGTSLWFEDVVGHVNVPEWMLWDGAPAAIATISPTSVPFNRQVTVVIQVKNVRTSTTLNGEVYVNGKHIGSTVKPISHTFEPVSIEMFSTPEPDPDTGGAVLNIGAFVDNDDDSDPAPVPPREVNPKVTVRVPGYPEAAVPLLFYYP